MAESIPVSVTCARCGDKLRVWELDGNYYVGCPFKGCPLTFLTGGMTEVADHIRFASPSAPSPAPGGEKESKDGK